MFKLHPSRIFTISLVLAFLLTTLIVLNLSIPIIAKFFLVGLLAWVLVYYLLRDALLLLPSSQIGLRLQEEQIVLIAHSGKEVSGRIMIGSLVTPVLTILNVLLENNNAVKSVVIFNDGMGAEDYRSMRVRLRWRE